MKLCDNPKCTHHCDVELIAGTLHYANGFKMPVDKFNAKLFNPDRNYNYCVCCTHLKKQIRKQVFHRIKRSKQHHSAHV